MFPSSARTGMVPGRCNRQQCVVENPAYWRVAYSAGNPVTGALRTIAVGSIAQKMEHWEFVRAVFGGRVDSLLYTIPQYKRVLILKCLVEGMSMLATARIADVSKHTVTKLLIDAGKASAAYQDRSTSGGPAQQVGTEEALEPVSGNRWGKHDGHTRFAATCRWR